jgi:hypothetical protein
MPAGLVYLAALTILCGLSVGVALAAAAWLGRRDHDPPH